MAYSQDTTSKWSLQKCVEYAMKNNISVKQADVQARITALQLKQAKLYQYPSVSFSTNGNFQFGRSIDPTTNLFTNTEIFTQNYNVSGGVQIFNWGRLKNNIAVNQFNLQAALADVEKTVNDNAIVVASYYLSVLANNEQIRIAQVKVNQTKAQLDITTKKVSAGSLPELNQVQLESQLASDSSDLITAEANLTASVLNLKAVLSLDAATPFETETPPLEKIPVETLSNLQPDAVYLLALNTQPLQKGDSLRIKAAEKNILAYKSNLYPTLSAGYGLGSTFNSKASQLLNPGVKIPYFNQLDNNFNQSVGLSIAVPIFGNGTRRISYEQSKLNVKTYQLQQVQNNLTLKNSIYKSYSDAVASLQKYNAGMRVIESAQKAYDFANKRYEVGLLGLYDLLVSQNELTKAKLQQVANQFDYIFKMKLLEFYKGQGIKL
jgi:outer membrane protein